MQSVLLLILGIIQTSYNKKEKVIESKSTHPKLNSDFQNKHSHQAEEDQVASSVEALPTYPLELSIQVDIESSTKEDGLYHSLLLPKVNAQYSRIAVDEKQDYNYQSHIPLSDLHRKKAPFLTSPPTQIPPHLPISSHPPHTPGFSYPKIPSYYSQKSTSEPMHNDHLYLYRSHIDPLAYKKNSNLAHPSYSIPVSLPLHSHDQSVHSHSHGHSNTIHSPDTSKDRLPLQSPFTTNPPYKSILHHSYQPSNKINLSNSPHLSQPAAISYLPPYNLQFPYSAHSHTPFHTPHPSVSNYPPDLPSPPMNLPDSTKSNDYSHLRDSQIQDHQLVAFNDPGILLPSPVSMGDTFLPYIYDLHYEPDCSYAERLYHPLTFCLHDQDYPV